MESERRAIEKIATALRELEGELIKFGTVAGYGLARYGAQTLNISPESRPAITIFINTINSKIQAIRNELMSLTKDEDLIKKIMGN